MPNAVAAPDSHDGPAAKLVAAGLEVVVEDGMTKGEWNGLEIVRVVGSDAQVEVGIGMIAIVAAEEADAVVKAFAAAGERAVRIGTLVPGSGEAKVVYRNTLESA